MGSKQSTKGSKTPKTVGSLKPTSKSKKTKKSESMAPDVIDITKSGGDEAKTQLRHKKRSTTSRLHPIWQDFTCGGVGQDRLS